MSDLHGSADDSSRTLLPAQDSHRISSIEHSMSPSMLPPQPSLPSAATDPASSDSTRSRSHHTPFASLWSANASTTSSISYDTADVAPAAFPTPGAATLDLLPRRRPPKSVGTSTTLSSQPVIVRTYSASRSSSLAHSPQNTPLVLPMPRGARLPPVEEFTFEGILRAVDSEIHGTIDAIAEICARSRMSLADEYSAHLPPQGEILPGNQQWRGRHGHAYRTSGADHPLTAVPEASSSSERLAGESRASSSKGKGKSSAVGSLKSIISASRRQSTHEETTSNGAVSPTGEIIRRRSLRLPPTTSWTIRDTQDHQSITILSSPTASKQLSLDSSTAVGTTIPPEQNNGLRALQAPQRPQLRARASTLSSISSWLPWSRATGGLNSPVRSAETNLRDLLRSSTAQPDKDVIDFAE